MFSESNLASEDFFGVDSAFFWFLYRLGYVKKGTAVLKPPLHFDGFGSMFLYKRWYRCHIALESFAADTGVIERRENLSSEEFHTKYDGKKPVRVISWCCFFIWKIKYASAVGNLIVQFFCRF